MLNHLAEFFGRTHLLVLHFPIALILCAACVETLSALNTRRAAPPHAPTHTGSVMFLFALIGCLYSAASGIVLGFNAPPKVDAHRIAGIASAAIVIITAIALLRARRPQAKHAPRIYLALLLISAGAIAFTAHLGGELTHGQGHLTRPLKHLFAPSTAPYPATEPIDPAALRLTQAQLDLYLDQIQPIFNASCIDCHGPEDAENAVRLDSITHTLDPSTQIILRGQPDLSELIYLIEVPADDPDIMPPEDHADPLTPEQTSLIREWVGSLAP